MQRTQILLRPEQHRILTDMAKRRGTSLSGLVREIVQRELDRGAKAAAAALRRRIEAIEAVRRHADEMLERRDGVPLALDIAELIRHQREERDAEILRGISPSDR